MRRRIHPILASIWLLHVSNGNAADLLKTVPRLKISVAACGHIAEGQECQKDMDYTGLGKVYICRNGAFQFANKYCNNGYPSCGNYPSCNQ
jgi:hypothetical protein